MGLQYLHIDEFIANKCQVIESEIVNVKNINVGTDDVCEWKLDGVYIMSPHKPLISCVTNKDYRYYFCPICGKKIKVVD